MRAAVVRILAAVVQQICHYLGKAPEFPFHINGIRRDRHGQGVFPRIDQRPADFDGDAITPFKSTDVNWRLILPWPTRRRRASRQPAE